MSDSEIRYAEPVLCYVKGAWAYFTTRQLDKQWGDDWNDAPYDCNAGDPYEFHEHNAKDGDAPWTIERVAFHSDLETPAHTGRYNSQYSVDQINAKHVPWLRPWSVGIEPIFAGTPMREFIRRIQAAGGTAYVAAAMEAP